LFFLSSVGAVIRRQAARTGYKAQLAYNDAIGKSSELPMTTAVTEICNAFKIAGVPDDMALKAAQSVTGSDLSHLATKADLVQTRSELETQLHQMETRIIKWNTAILVAMTAIFGAILKLL
jgi:hypothetical protein